MSGRQVWDHQHQRWLIRDQYGRLSLQPPTPPEPTAASIWLLGDIVHGVTDVRFNSELNANWSAEEVHVYIDCPGGHTAALTSMMAALRSHPAKRKIGHVVGKCFSAAAALFMCCDERRMCPGTALMIHDVHRAGDATEADSVAYSNAICDLFAARLPHVSRDQIREWQHKETYFNHAHAWRLGLATGLDFETLPRVAVDASRCNQPIQTNDFLATRQFNAKLATKRAFTIPAPKPIGQPTRQPFAVPPMPQSLRAHRAKSSLTAIVPAQMTMTNYVDGQPAELLIDGIIGDELAATDSRSIALFLRANRGKPVVARINSPGGDAFAGIQIFNLLIEHDGPVEIQIGAMAGSAASVCAMAGSKVKIAATGQFFIHRASILAGGNVDTMAEATTWLNAIDVVLAKIYAAKTGKPIAQIKEWMRGKMDGTLFSAREALTQGFVDEVMPIRRTSASSLLAASVTNTRRPLSVEVARARRLRLNRELFA